MDSTEQHRHTTEAREWLARIRSKRPRTESEGKRMLDDLIADIAKRRGAAAAQRLRDGIESARNKPLTVN